MEPLFRLLEDEPENKQEWIIDVEPPDIRRPIITSKFLVNRILPDGTKVLIGSYETHFSVEEWPPRVHASDTEGNKLFRPMKTDEAMLEAFNRYAHKLVIKEAKEKDKELKSIRKRIADNKTKNRER